MDINIEKIIVFFVVSLLIFYYVAYKRGLFVFYKKSFAKLLPALF